MPVGPLNVVTLQARNWESLVQWYQDQLGLVTIYLEEDDGFCLLSTGEGGAALAIASDHPEQLERAGENRIAPGFEVGDLAALLRRLVEANVRVDPNLDGGDEAYQLARVWDPEGNRLHLYCSGSQSVLVSPDDLDSLEETPDILHDPELVSSLERSRAEAARGESLPLPPS